ncbi:MAG: hypothetical protein P8Z79_16680 [Sedimentisphaerales bacterium]|jgi:predicted protein tyrosine phosphatase
MEEPEASVRTSHYLFICAVNRNRSKAAEQVCNQLAQAKGRNVQCESAGVNPLAVRRVTKPMADRADMIFVMEPYMKTTLETDFGQPAEKIVCLDIPDMYPMEDPELAAILRKELLPYI